MICFEVYRNGQLLCTAGLDGFGMLLAGVSRLRHHPGTLARFAEAGVPVPDVEPLTLNVSGHTDMGQVGNGSLTWVQEMLSVGDEVRIRVVQQDWCDQPGTRHAPPDPETLRRHDEQLYRDLGKKLGRPTE
jgi:hypothetical protein